MKSLRVILAMVEPPLPFGGAAARVYYSLLKVLVERGHHVRAFASCSKPDEIAKVQKLFPASRYQLRCYPYSERYGIRGKTQSLRRPFSFMFSDAMRADLRRELDAGFDVLHLEQLMSGWLGLERIPRSLVSVHFLSSIDLSSYHPPQLKARLQRALLLRTERRLLRAYKFFRALSPRLVRPIRKINSLADVTAVTPGLDLSLYPYIPDNRRPGAPVVTLIGSMAWHPTHSAAVRLLTKLYPLIKQQLPSARFQIVGWSARSVLREYVGLPEVEIVENVPDTRPFFENAGLLLYAPSEGSGIKIKVVEAMAYGVPVVTTSEGVEGLTARDGVDVSTADDDEGLVSRTIALLSNPRLQNRQRAAARGMLEVTCNPALAGRELEEIYERVIGFDPAHQQAAPSF
jgi:polysaccharide biosynthesis protein PslH